MCWFWLVLGSAYGAGGYCFLVQRCLLFGLVLCLFLYRIWGLFKLDVFLGVAGWLLEWVLGVDGWMFGLGWVDWGVV